MDQAIDWLGSYLQGVVSSPQQMLAHAAALLGVLLAGAAALMRTMIPLRWLGVGSSLGLLVFGVLHPSPTTAAVAALLLPINVWRALEMMRLARRVTAATASADLASLWLKPYMKPMRLRAGRVLFHKGDKADRLYLLTDGELEVVEMQRLLLPGRVFGEIALFAPDRVRTATVRATRPCVVLWIHESTVRQLYFQNPAFGFHLIQLLAERLSTDVSRMERRWAEGTLSGTFSEAGTPPAQRRA